MSIELVMIMYFVGIVLLFSLTNMFKRKTYRIIEKLNKTYRERDEIHRRLHNVRESIIISQEEIIRMQKLKIAILDEQKRRNKMSPTVNQILNQKEERTAAETSFVAPWRATKEHKREKLARIAKEEGIVSFVVKTPGSSQGDPVQAIILRDATVKKTKEGNYIVTGRDLEEEERIQLSADHVRRAYKSRPKKEMVFRAYRVDRIINKTIK